jgi:hypothetical protein
MTPAAAKALMPTYLVLPSMLFPYIPGYFLIKYFFGAK